MKLSKKKIKYIGFYDYQDDRNTNRVCSLAAVNVMDYIYSAIIRAGYDAQIISPSWIGENKRNKQRKKRSMKVNHKIDIIFCPSWKTSNIFFGYIKKFFSLVWLFLYLLSKTEKNEKIIIYHTPVVAIPVIMAKFLKRFKIILEIGEIYGRVWKNKEEIYGKVWKNKIILNMVEKKLIDVADYYILHSDLLTKKLNISENIILYGGYSNINKKINYAHQKEYINIVYTGSIDSLRGAALNIIETAKNLKNNYIIHILGYGDKEQIEKMKQQIFKTNNILKRKVCIYHGTKTGEEFTNFLSSCHIGLNPQITGDYMDTAFPSKILTYLSHNLRVVSTPIKSVLESSISDMINFTKSDSPKDIAKTIMSVNVNKPYDSISRIKKLDKKFVQDIKKLLEE